jgi:sulfhydrogenase subunit beta (sulfur reductase)
MENGMNSENIINLEQVKRYFFDHDTTLKFIKYLMKKATVIAPQAKGEASYVFDKVQDAEQVVLDYPRTIQPLKKYFLPPRETLLHFNLQDNSFYEAETVNEKMIFFGIHAYDMQAIHRLDYAFSKKNAESNYFKRRHRACFIGISFQPDQWHFSKSVGIEIEKLDGFCLFFEPVEKGYLVFEINETGREMLAEFNGGVLVDTPLDFEVTPKNFKAKIKYHYNRLPQVFEYVYHSKVWEEVAKKCVGCGTCNLLCPTCYCFDVRDEVDLNIIEGNRQRVWDGCMLNGFAEVAGGEDFRDRLDERTRHRLYRKFKYITEQSGELHCVGCGRCSKYCPAGISLVDILNDLIIDYTDQAQKQAI